MYRNPLFISWVLVLVLIAGLHILALELYLYWLYAWFDIVVHFLGGVFVGLSFLWLFFESGYIHIGKSVRNVFIVTTGAIILVGVGWEVFEVLAGVPIEDNFYLDTAIDLTMDILGACLAGLIFINIYVKNTTEHGDEY